MDYSSVQGSEWSQCGNSWWLYCPVDLLGTLWEWASHHPARTNSPTTWLPGPSYLTNHHTRLQSAMLMYKKETLRDIRCSNYIPLQWKYRASFQKSENQFSIVSMLKGTFVWFLHKGLVGIVTNSWSYSPTNPVCICPVKGQAHSHNNSLSSLSDTSM